MTKQTDLERIAGQAMKALVQKAYLQNETDSKPASEVQGYMTRHLKGDQSMNEAFRLAMTFNSLAEYDVAIADIQKQVDDFGDAMAERGAMLMQDSEDEDDMEDAMSDIVFPMLMLSKQDVLKRLACTYACLLLEVEKLESFYGHITMDNIESDAMLASYLQESFSIMKDNGTLLHWNEKAAILNKNDRSKLLGLQKPQPTL